MDTKADLIHRYYTAMLNNQQDWPAFEAFLRENLAQDVQFEDFPFGNTAQVGTIRQLGPARSAALSCLSWWALIDTCAVLMCLNCVGILAHRNGVTWQQGA